MDAFRGIDTKESYLLLFPVVVNDCGVSIYNTDNLERFSGGYEREQ